MSGGYYTPTAAGPGEFSAAQKAQLISWFGGGASAGFGPAIINHPTRLTVGESGKEMVFTARAQGGFGIGDLGQALECLMQASVLGISGLAYPIR